MRTTWHTFGIVLAVGVFLAASASPAAFAATTSLPSSIAGLGDSITQAMNSDALGDQPEHSWSYGTDARDGIDSHYERILAQNGNIRNNDHQDAVSGAQMIDLDNQANEAVTENAEYVTILMGANDVCTDSPDTMTSVADFEAQFRAAVDTLTTGLPESTVYVLTVPDVYHLWYILHDNPKATNKWQMFNICQSMLDESRTEEERQYVRQRNIDFNHVLDDVVAETASAGYDWHFDGWGTFDYKFKETDVSTVDYFHPSKAGQAAVAEESWVVGPFA